VNRDQKAAVVDQVAADIQNADAVFAVDYRGMSVTQAAELRGKLIDADAALRVVKNTLTERAADQAGAESLKELLEGPTALTFVNGDVAVAAKALATFRRQNGVLEFKGGQLGDETLSVEQIESIARLPARDALMGQFVGVVASPITGVVRGLNALISGIAVQLGQIAEQGLIGQGAPAAEAEAPAAEPEAPAEEASTEEAPPEPEASAETETATETETPSSEGETTEETEEG
jgi:large subunit ribosomal protein L10